MARKRVSRRVFLGASAASAAAAFGGCRQAADGEATARGNAAPKRSAVAVDKVTPAFPAAEYADRVRRVRELMARDKIDLLWVTSPEGMCYLHGLQLGWYQSHSPKDMLPISGTAVHVNHDVPVHFDGRGHEGSLKALSVSTDNRYVGGVPGIVNELKSLGWLKGTVGQEHWSYRPNRAVSEMVQAALRSAGCTVVDGSDVMRQAQVVKSPAEIAMLEEASRICDIGHQAVADTLRPGVTELEVYSEAIRAMAYAGGELSALPLQATTTGRGTHAVPTRQAFKAGDFVFADLCGVVNRYHANRARNYFLGDPPRDAVDIYAKNAGAFAVLQEAGRAGTPIPDVCSRLRAYYKDAGVGGGAFGYQLGISFPPDWVGPFHWSFGGEDGSARVTGWPSDPATWVFEHGMVTNYESAAGWGDRTRVNRFTMIDTIVFERPGARRLSKLPLEIVAIG
jgi:Xaa-Pro aminopeptidase